MNFVRRAANAARSVVQAVRTVRGRSRRRNCCSIAKKALRIAKGLKKQQEKKNIDTHMAPTLVADTPSASYCLNGLTQGDDPEGKRQGDKVKLLTVQCKGTFQTASSEHGCIARLIVFYDRDPQGALTTWNEVITGTDQIEELYTIRGSKRGTFQVLYDRMFKIPPTNIATQQNKIAFKFFRKVNRDAEYNIGNAGTIADISKGSLIAMAMSSGNASNLLFEARFRVMYNDL